ncbi:MAG: hypothetical protein ACTSRE_07745 [Promethearchaeota archaeon]
MSKKIQIKSVLGNKFVVEKGKTESLNPEDEFYHVIFDEKGYIMTKEEVKKLQKFFNDIELD